MNDKQYKLLLKKIKTRPRKSVVEFPDLKIQNKINTSDVIGGNCFRKDPLRHKWKNGQQEKPETIKAIENRQKRVAILCNKGSYQLITGDVDPKNLGRK